MWPVTCRLLVIALLLIYIRVSYQLETEYCEAETFAPECDRGEVILMRRAVYGRMHLGRCLATNFGYLGCNASVLSLTDERCGGQSSCRIRLPDPDFDEKLSESCHSDLKTHLLAGYDCVEVLQPDQNCDSNNPAVVHLATNTSGFLSPTVTMATSCGSDSFPWTLVAPPGQKLRFVLFTFDTRRAERPPSYKHCWEYASVYDHASKRTTTVCKGADRRHEILVSHNNSVDVSMRTGTGYNYLIQYAVIGCADLPVPDTMWFQRVNDDLAIVGCHVTADVWKLHCQGGVWQGQHGNCSQRDDSSIFAEEDPTDESLLSGLPLAIIISLALLVGVVVFLVGLVLLCRLQKTDPRPPRIEETMAYGLTDLSRTSLTGSQATTTTSTSQRSGTKPSISSPGSEKIYEKYRLPSERYTPVHTCTNYPLTGSYHDDQQTCVKCANASTKSLVLRTNGCDVENVVFVDDRTESSEDVTKQRVMLYPMCDCLSEVQMHDPETTSKPRRPATSTGFEHHAVL